MGVHKVLFAGLPGSGKTSLLKAVSDMPIVEVEKRMIGTARTRNLQYGRVYLEPAMLYLYATDVELNRDSEDWLNYLADEMSLLVLVIDGTATTADVSESLVYATTPRWEGRIALVVSKLDDETYRSDVHEAARRACSRTWEVYRDPSLARSLASDLRDDLEASAR